MRTPAELRAEADRLEALARQTETAEYLVSEKFYSDLNDLALTIGVIKGDYRESYTDQFTIEELIGKMHTKVRATNSALTDYQWGARGRGC